MTDEQIMDSLKCCQDSLCTVCPNKNCTDDLFELALDLIKRQKAEIERMKKIISYLVESIDCSRKEYNSLWQKMQQAKLEAIKEFADKINELLARYSHLHNNAENARQDTIEAADGTDIEMQSVWDVFTLKNNEMAEYEEMNRLQKNIEVIAEERLLKEIEKDFRLLVKEMTEVQE